MSSQYIGYSFTLVRLSILILQGELSTSSPCPQCGKIRDSERKMKQIIMSVMERVSHEEKINDKVGTKIENKIKLTYSAFRLKREIPMN